MPAARHCEKMREAVDRQKYGIVRNYWAQQRNVKPEEKAGCNNSICSGEMCGTLFGRMRTRTTYLYQVDHMPCSLSSDFKNRMEEGF